MNRLLSCLSMPLLLVLAAPVPARSHADRGVDAAAMPTPGPRWKTDAPLREGMGRIRAAVAALGHLEHGHLGREQALQLASGIERDVRFIIAHCRLEPRADAALHPILGALMQGARALKANLSDVAAIPPMRAALQDYSRTFEDSSAAPVGL